MKFTFEDIFWICVLVVCLTGLGLISIAQPYFEAQSFNRVCKANVSTWDAIWLELRVDNCVNNK